MNTKPLLIIACLVVNLVLAVAAPASSPEYVGVENCKSCHESQYEEWKGSQHEQAMMHASDTAVRGDFNNAKVTFKNQQYRFFRKGKEFWVSIPEPDGKLNDYKISYTFGIEPLQQYLVEFNDGRVQAIPHAWDSRSKSEGGQRWYYQLPDHSEPHHEFYWKNVGQNWNYMCSDCHSTGVKRNFDLKTNTFNTTFEEINVACEACHGPASEHIAWSALDGDKSSIPDMGFDRTLRPAVTRWEAREGSHSIFPAESQHTDQVLVCAQCHSRHVQLNDDDSAHLKNFGDRYRLTLIGDLYHPDGQVNDEDYVYGSYLQSKMEDNKVVCTNCHNPHTGKTIMPVESVCLQCHMPNAYATPEHHHHQVGTEGAQCVSCHMPESRYMGVDDRREHLWHVPRPDQSEALGTPNVCTGCHEDKNNQWAVKETQKWGVKYIAPSEEKSFATAFAMAIGDPAAGAPLSHIAQDINQPDIIRASALERLAEIADGNTLIASARGTKSDNEYIRMGSARAAANLPAAERWRIVSPLLEDEVLAVRNDAVAALTPLWQNLSTEQRKQLEKPLAEYHKVQNFNADRAYAHVNIGNVAVHKGDLAAAKAAYQQGIRVEPTFDMAHVYLAEVYRMRGEDALAIEALNNGEKFNPDNGVFAYQLGLGEIRAKRYDNAVTFFQKATHINPDNARYHYLLGLSLERGSPALATQSLAKAYHLSGNPEYLYASCELSLRHNLDNAQTCISELKTLVPANVIEQLLNRHQQKPNQEMEQ